MRVALLVLCTLAIVGGGGYVLLSSGSGSGDAQAMQQARTKALALRAAAQPPLTIPDVRGEVLVNAKEDLERAGLAWEVVGRVQGFHTNFVASISPAPGTRVFDTGSPLVTLKLERNASEEESGVPEQHSLDPGTAIRVANATVSGVTSGVATAAKAKAKAPEFKVTAAPVKAKAKHVVTKPKTAPAKAKVKIKAKPKTMPVKAAVKVKPRVGVKPQTHKQAPVAPVVSNQAIRRPAFVVPGAKKELAGELPLPLRAQKLLTFVKKNKKPTNRIVKHWLVQHAWIVSGARFGWWHGEEALQILLRADRQVERQWGIGLKSESVARNALAYVRAHERSAR